MQDLAVNKIFESFTAGKCSEDVEWGRLVVALPCENAGIRGPQSSTKFAHG